MDKQKKMPALRFPEFSGDWEIKILDDITEKISDGYHGTPVYDENGEFYFINGNNLINDTVFVSETTKRVNNEQFEIHKKPLNGNTILLSINGTIGNLAFYNNEKIILGKSACYINLDNNSNIGFIFYQLKTKKINDFFISELTGTTIKNLSLSTIKNTEIFLPVLTEQQKIASFLLAVDNKLQTLKKKKTLLEQYKKGLMQKIFSHELRFKDENGNEFPDWKKKKLGKVCEIIAGGTPETNNDAYWNGDIQWFTPTEIKGTFVSKSLRTITELGLKKSSAKLLPKGTILLTTRATIGEASIALEECTTNQGFQSLVVNENNNNIYLFNWIKFNKHELIKRANGSTFSEISKSNIEQIFIPVPCLKEQTKIATILSSIDEKISLCDTQIEKTEQYKKGMLQKMFV